MIRYLLALALFLAIPAQGQILPVKADATTGVLNTPTNLQVGIQYLQDGGSGVVTALQATPNATGGFLLYSSIGSSVQGKLSLTTTGSSGAATLTGNALNIPQYSGNPGTVTSFSAGNLSPFFTTSVATATSTPALTFSLSNAAQNSVLAGPASGGAGAPSYQTAPTFSGANLTSLPTPSSFSGNLAGDVTGTQSSTVVGRINGISLAGLSTGLLKNTTSTGVPVIAIAGTDFVIPSGSITGSAGSVLLANITGMDATVKTAAALPANGPGGFDVRDSSGNITTTVVLLPTGPSGMYTVLNADSRFAGPQGIGTNRVDSTITGYIDRMGGQLQTSGFFANTTVGNFSRAGMGIQYGVNQYAASSVQTTGTVVSGNNTITVTGSITGIPTSGSFGIGFPGCPLGAKATFNGVATITVQNVQTPAVTPSMSGSFTLDIATVNDTGTSINQTPHQASSAVTTNTTGSFFMPGWGINDVQTLTFSGGTATSGSPTITGLSIGAFTYLTKGYTVTVTGTGTLPANCTVLSNTSTSVTLNNNASGSGSVTVTVTPVASAWETQYGALITASLADNYKVVCITIPKAWTGAWLAGDAFRQTINAWLLSTYGTTSLGSGAYSGTTANVYVIDSASMPIFGSNDTAIYVDGLHLTTRGEALWASFISSASSVIFSSQISLKPIPVAQAFSIPWNAIGGVNQMYIDEAGSYTIPVTIGKSGVNSGIGLSGGDVKITTNGTTLKGIVGSGAWVINAPPSSTIVNVPLVRNGSGLVPEVISTTTAINAKTVANTLLYTVPTGKTFTLLGVVLRTTATTGGATGPSVNVFTSTAGDLYATQAIGATSAVGQCFIFPNTGVVPSVPAAGTVNLGITVGGTSTTETVQADVIGYLE